MWTEPASVVFSLKITSRQRITARLLLNDMSAVPNARQRAILRDGQGRTSHARFGNAPGAIGLGISVATLTKQFV